MFQFRTNGTSMAKNCPSLQYGSTDNLLHTDCDTLHQMEPKTKEKDQVLLANGDNSINI